MTESLNTLNGTAVCQRWEETEKDWGVRPDGFSLHLSIEGLKKYIHNHWAQLPDNPPHSYSRPSGEPYVLRIEKDMMDEIVANDGSLRLYTNEFSGFAEQQTRVRGTEIVNNYLDVAKAIAHEAHKGQLYGDRDYVEAHIEPVASLIAGLGYGIDYQAVGWLHDVFEDSEIGPTEVLNGGVPPHVVKAAQLLTKKSGVEHQAYLDEISKDPLAAVGKFADSSLNYANTALRLSQVYSAHDHKKLLEYAKNIATLLPLIAKAT